MEHNLALNPDTMNYTQEYYAPLPTSDWQHYQYFVPQASGSYNRHDGNQQLAIGSHNNLDPNVHGHHPSHAPMADSMMSQYQNAEGAPVPAPVALVRDSVAPIPVPAVHDVDHANRAAPSLEVSPTPVGNPPAPSEITWDADAIQHVYVNMRKRYVDAVKILNGVELKSNQIDHNALRISEWRAEGHLVDPAAPFAENIKDCSEDVNRRHWVLPEEKPELIKAMAVYRSTNVRFTAFMDLTLNFLRRHPDHAGDWDWSDAEILTTAKPTQRAFFAFWYLRLARWFKRNVKNKDALAILAASFPNLIFTSMELMRERRNLSLLQAYYALNKDELKKDHWEEWRQDNIGRQSRGERTVSWVNWSQSLIKGMMDSDRAPPGVSNWKDRLAKALFLANYGFEQGKTKPAHPELSATQIEKNLLMMRRHLSLLMDGLAYLCGGVANIMISSCVPSMDGQLRTFLFGSETADGGSYSEAAGFKNSIHSFGQYANKAIPLHKRKAAMSHEEGLELEMDLTRVDPEEPDNAWTRSHVYETEGLNMLYTTVQVTAQDADVTSHRLPGHASTGYQPSVGRSHVTHPPHAPPPVASTLSTYPSLAHPTTAHIQLTHPPSSFRPMSYVPPSFPPAGRSLLQQPPAHLSSLPVLSGHPHPVPLHGTPRIPLAPFTALEGASSLLCPELSDYGPELAEV